MLGSISVVAQRPVGDTILMGSNSEYLYDSVHLNGAYLPTLQYNTSNPNFPFQIILDNIWMSYYSSIFHYYWNMLDSATVLNFIHEYPNLSNYNTGRHITGWQFATPDDDIVIKGLAVCPTIINTEQLLECATDYRWRGQGIDTAARYVIDTTLVGRETEYVQLYTIEGGQPQFQAEGGWRIEYPHRYMLFPRSYECSHLTALAPSNDTIVVPIYETMFDTSILIEPDKVQYCMLAFTHNNNNAVWSLTANDTVFPSPNICWEHYPIAYSYSVNSVNPPMYSYDYWVKYDTFPWYNIPGRLSRQIFVPNIFPILDTLFGTPCAAVTGLQTVEVDSLWATLMWSADARHQEWEVAYRPVDDSLASDSMVTVNVPTVTLTGLTPGTTYSVKVRGLCDACIDNYSPWCETLQFVTLYTPPDTTPDTLPYIRPHTLGIGNLDRYTRIMPNPAHDVVNVLSSYQLKSVAVYDLTGRQLLILPVDGMTATVDVSTLPRGTYILAIRTLQGVASKKLKIEN